LTGIQNFLVFTLHFQNLCPVSQLFKKFNQIKISAKMIFRPYKINQVSTNINFNFISKSWETGIKLYQTLLYQCNQISSLSKLIKFGLENFL
jgi:hypothetical protein